MIPLFMKNKILFLSTLFLFSFFISFSQTDLLDIADKQTKPKKEFTIATFKYTRLINTHTAETLGKKTLDVAISHRFGNLNSGGNNLWGLDGPANIRLAFEYSHNGRLMIGLGRSSYQKMFDSFLKYRWLRQTTDGKMPLSVTLYAGMFFTTLKDANKLSNGFDRYQYASDRLSYVYQIIIARKFSSRFSLQLAPIMVHYNQVEKIRDKNDSYALSTAARFKVSKRLALTTEYVLRLNHDYDENKYYDSFGVGIDIETGGHVFQIHLTNSFGIADNQFIPYTSTQWNNAGIRIGYNLSRVFSLQKKEKKK